MIFFNIRWRSDGDDPETEEADYVPGELWLNAWCNMWFKPTKKIAGRGHEAASPIGTDLSHWRRPQAQNCARKIGLIRIYHH